MVSLLQVILSAVLVLTDPFAVALDIDDLFTISYGMNDPGSCFDRGQAEMAALLTDTLALSGSAIATIDDRLNLFANLNEEAFRLSETFFLGPAAGDLTTAKLNYQKVQSFLTAGGAVNNGASTIKPWLVCSDSWEIRQQMGDQMLDSTGKEMTKSDGTKYFIKDDPNYVAAQATVTTNLGETAYPYWSPVRKAYRFDKQYGPQVTDGYCSAPESQGGTQTPGANGAIVILCPRSFTGIGVRQITATPVDASAFIDDKAPPGSQRITNVQPQATTFFHELFHLVFGNQMLSSSEEEYLVRKMLGVKNPGWGTTQALKNPETYTNVAIGYDYTSQAPLDPGSGLPVEFYTGWCSVDR